ncbi:ADP-ribosylation_factor [Hexamita inflata]|uniref:ADP-ribosylation factor n=1 Tax=Hexamita inflata TaxID=28002 RepID=A0AA86PNM6_9EUKA|nr:ADP-ribosylation factor [Hexamita inflata]
MKQVLTYKKKQLHVTDLGGQDEQRAKWSEHFQNVHAVVFVVDSHDLDPERLQLAASELKKIMETLNAKLLVFANKMDLPRAINAKEITEHLQLNSIQKQWAIQECCAVSGEGLYEGLDKLLLILKRPSGVFGLCVFRYPNISQNFFLWSDRDNWIFQILLPPLQQKMRNIQLDD